MLAKSRTILVDLPATRPDGISWYSQPMETIDIRVLGTIREPFTALQAEHQADHQDTLASQEVRIGQRIP